MEDFCVGPGTSVTLLYTVRDEDGEVVDEATPGAPLVYIHGFGQILPALEDQLEEMLPGESRTFTLSPDEAYGPLDPDGVFQVHRSDFPDASAIELGDEFEIDGPDGEEMLLRVVDFADDQEHVVVDANHPFAGVTLSIEVKIEAVRPATEQEMSEAEAALVESGCDDGLPGAGGGLVRLSRRSPKGKSLS